VAVSWLGAFCPLAVSQLSAAKTGHRPTILDTTTLGAVRAHCRETSYVESFNSRIRDECLNITGFWSLTQARVVISDWKHDYSHHRRHSALGYQPQPAMLPPVPTVHDDPGASPRQGERDLGTEAAGRAG
jgi:transposase InsO family protein